MTKPKKTGAPVIYVIGSLRNPRVPEVAATIRRLGFEAFDNWYSGGERADDAWKAYENARGNGYIAALNNHSARHTFAFDEFHLNRAHAAVLVLPAGRSGHLEAGFVSATKPVFALLDAEGEPDRLDVMTQFLYKVCPDETTLEGALNTFAWPRLPPTPFHTIADVSWLAGVFEGDGTFCISGKTPRMNLQMTDLDVIERAARIFDSSVWRAPLLPNRKQVYVAGAAGLSAIEWMRIIRPYMGRRRQQQIVDTAVAWLDRRHNHKSDRAWWERVFQLQVQP